MAGIATLKLTYAARSSRGGARSLGTCVRSLEKQLKASLRRVRLEGAVGALSAGRAKHELAKDYAQVKQSGLLLDPRLEKATLDALRGPVRSYQSRLGGYWNSCLAIFQPLWLGAELKPAECPVLDLSAQLAPYQGFKCLVAAV
ncbi:hypothetical protein JST97_17090 [bacterium]|nr:hypothetical protein [bacterium]